MNLKLTGREFKGMAGAYAAMFVPYDRKGRIDTEAIGRIMDYGYANGLNGFYLTGCYSCIFMHGQGMHTRDGMGDNSLYDVTTSRGFCHAAGMTLTYKF